MGKGVCSEETDGQTDRISAMCRSKSIYKEGGPKRRQLSEFSFKGVEGCWDGAG